MTVELLAQAPAAGEGGIMNSPMFPMLLIGIMLLFWVVVVLPMSRRQKKEQAALLANLKRGTKVLLASGIMGTIVSVKDAEDEMVIRSEDSRLKVLKSTVIRVLGADDTEPK